MIGWTEQAVFSHSLAEALDLQRYSAVAITHTKRNFP
jgi:hypothetical protein